MTHQQHVIVLDEFKASALEYVLYKLDLDVGGIMIGTVKILQVKDFQKTGLRNPDGDINVSDTLSNMLTKVHKEVDGPVHEDVEDDNGIVDDRGDYHYHSLKYLETIVDEAIYKNENILLDSMDDISPQNNEDIGLINRDEVIYVSEDDKKHV